MIRNVKIDKVVSVHDIAGSLIIRWLWDRSTRSDAGCRLYHYGRHLYDGFGIYRGNTFLNIKIPTLLEMPELVGDFVETIDPFGPYGAKGLAEPPIIAVAPAITNAIYDAIGVRATQIPLTPERMQKLLESKKKES
jgi:hypothetical protein